MSTLSLTLYRFWNVLSSARAVSRYRPVSSGRGADGGVPLDTCTSTPVHWGILAPGAAPWATTTPAGSREPTAWTAAWRRLALIRSRACCSVRPTTDGTLVRGGSRNSSRPGGSGGKPVSGASASMAFIYSAQMGAGTVPPNTRSYCLPLMITFRSGICSPSKPTHTAVLYSGVNPTYQASRYSWWVPVLPP